MRKLILLALCMSACATQEPAHVIPSLEYTKQIKREMAEAASPMAPQPIRYPSDAARARLNFVSNEGAVAGATSPVDSAANIGDLVPSEEAPKEPGFYEYRSSAPTTRDYNGPLSLGDPGVAASLWRESRNGTELFRDDRAWQPMDLITILVSETAEGSKQADTEVKEKSTLKAAIDNLIGLESKVGASSANPKVDPSSLVSASLQNDFKGEGQTGRKDSLKAKISAMVAEVLPSGILRVEGERIVSVNSEEQVMVISGLVRPRDINSNNEVDSAKMANLRVDYYGRGIVGEAQNGGWLGRAIRTVWPF